MEPRCSYFTLCFFFFKQKTAYELRISDWSSDVCSSDLPAIGDVTTIGGVTGHVDRDNFYGLKSRDFRKTKTDQATMRFQHDFGGITLRNTSRYSRNSQSYILSQPDDSKGNVFGTDPSDPATAGGLVWRRANSRYGSVASFTNQTDLYGKFNTGSVAHRFAVGAEFSWEKARRGRS